MTTEIVTTSFQHKTQRSIEYNGQKLWNFGDTCDILGVLRNNARQYMEKVDIYSVEVYSDRTIAKTGTKFRRLQQVLFVTSKGIRDIARKSKSPIAQAYIDTLLEVKMPSMQQEIATLKSMPAVQDDRLERILSIIESNSKDNRAIIELFTLQFSTQFAMVNAEIEKLKDSKTRKILPKVTAGHESQRDEANNLLKEKANSIGITGQDVGRLRNDYYRQLNILDGVDYIATARVRKCPTIQVIEEAGKLSDLIDLLKK
jgi:prophage antirepressor-like protein